MIGFEPVTGIFCLALRSVMETFVASCTDVQYTGLGMMDKVVKYAGLGMMDTVVKYAGLGMMDTVVFGSSGDE